MSDPATPPPADAPRRAVKVYDRPESPAARFVPAIIIAALVLAALLAAKFLFRLF